MAIIYLITKASRVLVASRSLLKLLGQASRFLPTISSFSYLIKASRPSFTIIARFSVFVRVASWFMPCPTEPPARIQHTLFVPRFPPGLQHPMPLTTLYEYIATKSPRTFHDELSNSTNNPRNLHEQYTNSMKIPQKVHENSMTNPWNQ